MTYHWYTNERNNLIIKMKIYKILMLFTILSTILPAINIILGYEVIAFNMYLIVTAIMWIPSIRWIILTRSKLVQIED